MSLFGALLGSGPGFLILLVLYAANLYAAYEISIFRAQPAGLVCGVSAVLPLAGPIIFLSRGRRVSRVRKAEPMRGGSRGAGWHQRRREASDGGRRRRLQPVRPVELPTRKPAFPNGHAKKGGSGLPASTRFQRGQFTFNRRFLEAKFPGFFGVVRRDADRDMVLVVKSARGEYIGQRISRIAANDLHLQVQKGAASEEVMIPFQDIQEIVLRHKDG